MLHTKDFLRQQDCWKFLTPVSVLDLAGSASRNISEHLRGSSEHFAFRQHPSNVSDSPAPVSRNRSSSWHRVFSAFEFDAQLYVPVIECEAWEFVFFFFWKWSDNKWYEWEHEKVMLFSNSTLKYHVQHRSMISFGDTAVESMLCFTVIPSLSHCAIAFRDPHFVVCKQHLSMISPIEMGFVPVWSSVKWVFVFWMILVYSPTIYQWVIRRIIS